MQGDDALPSASWFAEMARGSGVMFFRQRVKPDLAYEFISDSLADLLGVSAEEAVADAHSVLDRVDPDHRDGLGAALALAPGRHATVELTWRHTDGRPVYSRCWMQASERDDGTVILEGTVIEISERKRLEAELTRLAVTDPVTGVWNRHHGRETLDAEISRPDRAGEHLSVLMVDIDNFKSINDTHGHQVGDEVLVETARRLADAVRNTDMVARWGGEEFVVMLRDCPLADAVARAETIRRQIADAPFADAGTVTISVGAAELTADEDLDHWFGRADRALYEAKRSGRNTVVGERR